jgi:formate hydrogenlyase subunit 6/NADH:ubiquinone oxidoreductase subunit I/coenzyme F420-reducing hydrogenase delta subunit
VPAVSSDRAVFLCRCNGRVTSKLPLEEIREWLREMKPGLSVVIADNLCQSQVMSQLIREHQVQPAVLAGCSHLKSEIALWQEPEKCAFDPDSVGIIDMVRELDPSYSSTDLVDRAKLLLWAQVKRQEKFAGVPSNARRAHFVRAQGDISRRDLFQSLIPKYRVTPYIDSAKCLGDKCRICRASCDSKSIISDGNAVSIDSANCRACGVCTISCPHQAIIYPNFSLDQLEAEVEGLLSDSSEYLRPRIIAMVCQSSQHPAFDANVLPVTVLCLGMVSPGLILRAIDLGAQGVVLISAKENCQLKLDCSNWKGTVQFLQRLLEHWSIEPERVSALDEENLTQGLPRFSQRIAELKPISFTSSQSTAIPDKGFGLPAAILTMSERLGAEATGKIASGTVPFGKITLDASKCTGCAVCAAQCPTDALTDLRATDSARLVFRQESCVGCGQCVDVCPEKCLHLTKVLEVSKLNREPQMIFEGEFAHCRVCGTPFAPKAMIESVRARLGTTGEAAQRMEICPKCRMRGRVRLAKSGTGV